MILKYKYVRLHKHTIETKWTNKISFKTYAKRMNKRLCFSDSFPLILITGNKSQIHNSFIKAER